MKIIFLDIDGVLAVNHKNCDEYGSLFHEQFKYHLYHIADSVSNLHVVVSSSWRKSGWIAIKEMWEHRKIHVPLLDITPSIRLQRGMIGFYKDITDQQKEQYRGYSIPRGCEIEYWLKEEANFQRINWSKEEQIKRIEKSKVKNYVILDDDSDMLLNQKEHYVKCSNQWNEPDAIEGFGLTFTAAMKAIEILNTDIIDLYYPQN